VRCQDISGGQIRVAIERNEGGDGWRHFLQWWRSSR
jgi:hypothetical protein